jgi:hypothetical protein
VARPGGGGGLTYSWGRSQAIFFFGAVLTNISVFMPDVMDLVCREVRSG